MRHPPGPFVAAGLTHSYGIVKERSSGGLIANFGAQSCGSSPTASTRRCFQQLDHLAKVTPDGTQAESGRCSLRRISSCLPRACSVTALSARCHQAGRPMSSKRTETRRWVGMSAHASTAQL
eukprot:6202968-Amphidinium_carterae.1